jgi:hypothetical protein
MVEQIIQQMRLREPQADSLIKFSQMVSAIDIKNTEQARIKRLLEAGTLRFSDDYARLTFALATGVGKTRLMGAITAYLFLENKSRHFVFLAPSSTILKKMKDEAVNTHKKYIFQGLAGFPLPEVIHADNIETYQPEQMKFTVSPTLFILSPGQIRARSGSEVERRLRREGEGFGVSFVDYLAGLDDLMVFLDEGHRYGQDAGEIRAWTRAINDLKPKLVIEMSATPTNPDTVLHRYDLKAALSEGKYIKNVTALVEQRQAAVTDEEWDKHTLLEGFRRLQVKKSSIAAFRKNYPEKEEVKPILLIAAQDTTHAAWVEQWILSDEFLNEINTKIFSNNPLSENLSQNQVLRVDITQSEEEIAKLLEVEKADNPIEIVINVGMLKEGWDVTNVYVIVPLRAMASVTLATQTIGRGLRLPYGQRVGDEEVDTLDVLAFGRETVQEVIEEARKVGVDVREGGTNGGNMTFRDVSPNREFKIVLPDISLKVVNPPLLKGWDAQRHVAIDLSQTAHIARVEAQTGKVEILGEAIDIDVPNPSRRLAHLLCRDISEITGQENEATRIFINYFENAGCSTVEEKQKALQIYGRQIYDDVKDQIENLIRQLETKYEHEEKMYDEFVFSKVTHSVYAQISVIDKNIANFPKDKQRLITGWTKSLYPENKFDTGDELIVAKILDNTDGVVWIRNPVRKFNFQTQAGLHYPDFIVNMGKNCIFIEVKDKAKLNDEKSDAFIKGKAATEWCSIATNSSDKVFEYWAIPNDKVSECATINDLKTKRFVF